MESLPDDLGERDAVNISIERAYEAARHGDLEALDAAIGRLRSVGPPEVAELAERLYRIAACARAHPSFPAVSDAVRGRAAG